MSDYPRDNLCEFSDGNAGFRETVHINGTQTALINFNGNGDALGSIDALWCVDFFVLKH